jgi:hypothetical protein
VFNNTTHPSSSVVSRVLISGNLSVISSGNSNFVNSLALLVFFVLFHDYQNLQIFACMDASLENVRTAGVGITYTACHILGGKQTTRLP